jgi:hypothetical protein
MYISKIEPFYPDKQRCRDAIAYGNIASMYSAACGGAGRQCRERAEFPRSPDSRTPG